MTALEHLLSGITIFSDVAETHDLTGEEVEDYHRRRFERIEAGVNKLSSQISLVNNRRDEALAAYDSFVLKGYSSVKDSDLKKERDKNCIPCFVSYPRNFKPWIRINWGLKNAGFSEETQIGRMRAEALTLEGEEADKLFYSLRSYFLQDLEAVNERYESLKDYKLVKADSEEMLELAGEKENLWSKLGEVLIRYQFMVQLAQAKFG